MVGAGGMELKSTHMDMETIMANTPQDTRPRDPVSDETSRFLERWRLEASVNGFLRVQPTGPNLDCAELSDLVGRLAHVYHEKPPSLLAFDFCDVALPIRKWRRIHTMLHEFAGTLGGCARVISAGSRSAAIVVISVFGGLNRPITC